MIFYFWLLQAIGVPKYCAEDLMIKATNAAGGMKMIPVFKGTHVIIHVAGLHYNRT